jgi:hypothetical protein
MEHLDTLLEADKDASYTFKNGFNGREIALDTIKGKSKNFNKLMNDKLQETSTAILIPAFSIKMSLAFVNVSWSAFNSLIFTETSTMSLSFAILVPKGEEFIRFEIKAF